MPERRDIDFIFRQWPYEPGVIGARIVRATDGRDVLQMRIEMGVLQMELSGRPDGQRPNGAATYLDWLGQQAAAAEEPLVLSEEQCLEIDREFLQYYHRRICLLVLREFGRAIADADHTLALMDFVATHSPDPQWSRSHERYRPFVIFHRVQAATMVGLEQSGPEAAIEEISRGLERMRRAFVALEAGELFEQDELVKHLQEMKESLRRQYHVKRTLAEQLADAVAAEEYERAAQLRDEISRRRRRGRR